MDIIKQNNLFNWIGGKKWLNNHIISIMNIDNKLKHINRYIEPFVGGMGAFKNFYTLLPKNTKIEYLINDINYPLMTLYNTIQNNPENLIKEYKKIKINFENYFPTTLFNKKDKIEVQNVLFDCQKYYLEQRIIFNELKLNKNNPILMAAIFLFLMEYTFNGIYRENKKGEFNVGYNWKVNLIDTKMKIDTINYYNQFFNYINISFFNENYDYMFKFQTDNSLFYFDPPYVKSNEAKSKPNSYSENEFTIFNQNELLNKIITLNNFVYSNHATNEIKKYFNNLDIKYNLIPRKNFISSKGNDRDKIIEEILVYKFN